MIIVSGDVIRFGERTGSGGFTLSVLILKKVQKNAFKEDRVHALEYRE